VKRGFTPLNRKSMAIVAALITTNVAHLKLAKWQNLRAPHNLRIAGQQNHE